MGGLYLQLRRLGLAALLLAVLSACADDEGEVPETLRGETTCMWVAGTQIHFEDGSSTLLRHPDLGVNGAACTCMTREEFDAGDWHEELNAQALEVCEELAAMYDYEWVECQEDYEAGAWFSFVFWDEEELEPVSLYDPGCVGS